MTTNEIMKNVTDEMKRNGASADDIAKMEMCIQYLGNEDFRKYINDYVWNENMTKTKTLKEVEEIEELAREMTIDMNDSFYND